MMESLDARRFQHSGGRRIRVSFEFFPPKDGAGEEVFWRTVRRLEPLAPDFASVTYGAGGTTRERTLAALTSIERDTRMVAAGHLTCVGASRAEVDAVARSYRAAGIRHILALRGDSQGGPGTPFEPHPEGYRNAADLVAGLRRMGDFTISVAAYPEGHPDSASLGADLDNLEAKADAGATQAITQFFFDTADYLALRERAASRAVAMPIIPGIVPIHNFRQVAGFAGRCGAKIPTWLAERFEGLEQDPETSRLVGIAVAAEQVMELIAEGVTRFHFYTLNRPELTYAMCRLIGLAPLREAGEAKVAKIA